MADDGLEYLEADFDPGSLTIPRLRSILVAHEVHYPSTAKKSQLIDLFNESVAPKAKRILSSRARTKRSARGIEDVESMTSQSTASDNEDAQDTIEPTPRRAPRRAASRQASEDVASVVPSARSSVARSSRQSSMRSTMTPEVSDAVTPRASKPARRGGRKSTAAAVASATTPAIKEEQEEESEDDSEEAEEAEDAKSPFSDKNPFQSGSSPVGFGETPSRDKKRRTMDTFELESRRKSTPVRRKTEEVTRFRRSTPAAAVKLEEIEPSEEFTPEEQEELEQEQLAKGTKDLLPARQKPRKRSTAAATLTTAPLAILIAILGAVGFLWRQEKISVGYCGVGRPPSDWLGGYELPEQLHFLQPECETCPPHAYCHADLQATCESDFMLVHHPLSLNGLLPIPPTCEPDSEKARKVQAVADKAVEELRERNAKFECGELKDDDGKKLSHAELPEEQLKVAVASKRRRGMSQAEFEDLWHSAIGDIQGRDEIVAGTAGLRSTSLARIGFVCAARRSVRVALVRNLRLLAGVALLAFGTFYARYAFVSSRALEKRAKELASLALDQLAAQASLHLQDADIEPYVSMAQLRDDVLRDEFSSKRRQGLWQRVQKKVESNSNIRARLAEGRSGEVSRVWEWVGAVHALENTPFANRRKSGRFSLGPVEGERRTSGVDRSSPVKWDEGRPIY